MPVAGTKALDPDRSPWPLDEKLCVNREKDRHQKSTVSFSPLVFHRLRPVENPVCPWDKSGGNLGQTQVVSLFYTVEVPWTNPGLSQGQTRGRRAAQKVYVKKVYVPFSLARDGGVVGGL